MSETWSKIKCPYCFKEFSHDEVHFRIAKATCDMAAEKMKKASSEEEKEVYEKFLRKSKLDEKYEKVWGKYRGGEPPAKIKEDFYIPWVDQSNKEEMIYGDFIKDENGFVSQIEDKLSQTISTYRICPECHNPLPPNYGKFPQKFISVLGISASGKTVFIKQLMSRIGQFLANVDASCTEVQSLDDDNFSLTCNKPLPESTQTLNFKPPYYFSATFNKDGKKLSYDFIIYDIAGEALVKAKSSQLNYFVGYIKVSDGMIMLIDPEQLMNNPQPEYPADQMFNTLHTLFNGNAIDIPMAITISKSDLILSNSSIQATLNPQGKYFNINSEINKDINWDSGKKYFYKDIYSKLSGQLRNFLNNEAVAFYTRVKNSATNPAYFAVSSLKNGVDQKLTFEVYPRAEWKSSDIESFAEKFPVLEEEFKYIKEDLKVQEENPNEHIININEIRVKRSFVFDQQDPIIKNLDSILENISTLVTRSDIRKEVFGKFSTDQKITLRGLNENNDITMTGNELYDYICHMKDENEKYGFDIYIQGYPRHTGALTTLRIEEPLLWLLSELEIIKSGNYDKPIIHPEPKHWWQKILKN